MVGGALGKGMALEDAGTMGRQGQNFFVLQSICFQRQLALTQHRLGAQHDSQQDLLCYLPFTIYHPLQSGTIATNLLCG